MGESSTITVELSRDEAIVLFEWLARSDDRRTLSFEDEAEQVAPWRLEGQLESTLVEQFSPDYASILETARSRLRQKIEE